MANQALPFDFSAVEFIQQNAIPIAVAVIILVLSIGFYVVRMNPSSDVTTQSLLQSKQQTPKFTSLPPASSNSNNNVWAERQRRGIAIHSSSKKETASPEKPFGSRYYYAHNSTNAKGGYTDGLRMEDYSMNGPRLLTKNGVPVVVEEEESNPDEKQEETTTEPTTVVVTQSTTPPPLTQPQRKIIPITKYLWDDPGDASGIATLRIEVLPLNSSSNPPLMDWKDANIQSVSAQLLEGDGLLVVATSSSNNDDDDDNEETEYRLHIPKLYDRATQVRTVVKPKRLLVKIHKKRNGIITILGKSNLEPWPQPQKIALRG